MPAAQIDNQFKLKVNGAPFAKPDMDAIVDLVVDSDYFLPTMFEITLQDTQNAISHNFEYIDSDKFKIGSAIEISVSADDSVTGKVESLLVKGEITSVEPVYTDNGLALLKVAGYDRSHRLTRGKKTRVFGDGKAASSTSEQDIISKIAQEAGLSANIDGSGLSSLKYAYVMQYNQSDWDFLWARARAIGYQVYVQDKAFYFQKAGKERSTGTQVELKWGETLTSFEPRISLMNQASEAEFRGWDPNQKKEIVGKATSASYEIPSQIGFPDKTGGATLKKAFSAAAQVSVDQPVLNQGMAKQMADADLSARESEFIQADGFLPRGNPKLLAGSKVKIKNVGQRFSGTYYLTKVRHQLREGLYTVRFSAAGSSPHTLYGMLCGDAPLDDRIGGPVVGIVTNNDDPEKLGRVRVKFPWLDANFESSFARICTPDGGKDRGFFFLPEVNDEVLVMFEHGDINFPYIIGGLWNKKDLPPKGTGSSVYASGKVNQRVIRSRTGHRVILDDTQGEEKILIENHNSNVSILMVSKDNSITIKSKGNFTIETDGKFAVKSKGDITLETQGGGKITAVSKIELEAKQEATIKAMTSQLALKAAGSELSGMKVDVKANTVASINGNAMVEVKGAMVKIN